MLPINKGIKTLTKELKKIEPRLKVKRVLKNDTVEIWILYRFGISRVKIGNIKANAFSMQNPKLLGISNDQTKKIELAIQNFQKDFLRGD